MEPVYFWLVGTKMGPTQTIPAGSRDVVVTYGNSLSGSGMSLKLAKINNIYMAEQKKKLEQIQFGITDKISYSLDHTLGTPSYDLGETWLIPEDRNCPNITASSPYKSLPGPTVCDVTKDITVLLCNFDLGPLSKSAH